MAHTRAYVKNMHTQDGNVIVNIAGAVDLPGQANLANVAKVTTKTKIKRVSASQLQTNEFEGEHQDNHLSKLKSNGSMAQLSFFSNRAAAATADVGASSKTPTTPGRLHRFVSAKQPLKLVARSQDHAHIDYSLPNTSR